MPFASLTRVTIPEGLTSMANYYFQVAATVLEKPREHPQPRMLFR